MTTQTTTETTTIHPFESAGLGKAPFRFVGMGQDLCYGEAILNREEYQRTGIRLTTKPGGTCAYCGTGIKNLYTVESADGNRFHVGCECIAKTGDKKLTAKADKARRDHEKKLREERQRRNYEAAKQWFADRMAQLAELPHPNAWAAEQGKTGADWAQFMLEHCGLNGLVKARNRAERMLGEK